MIEIKRTGKRIPKKNAPAFDVEKYAIALWRVNAMAIPGVGANALLTLIGELGHDFRPMAHFAGCDIA